MTIILVFVFLYMAFLTANGILAWPLSFLFNLEGGGLVSLLVSMKFYATATLWVYFLSRLWQTAPDPSRQSKPKGPQAVRG